MIILTLGGMVERIQKTQPMPGCPAVIPLRVIVVVCILIFQKEKLL